MPPCHTTPFVQPGVLITVEPESEPGVGESSAESCDYCGMTRLEWRKCKLICAHCNGINKSCADL